MINFTSGSYELNTLSSLLPNYIKQSQLMDNWADFQNRTSKKLAMYYEDWEYDLKNYIFNRLSKESREHFFPVNQPSIWPLPTHINLLKRVTDEISLIYKENAKRSFVYYNNFNEEIFDERYNHIVKRNFNSILQTINKLVNVCNVVIVRIIPNPNTYVGMNFHILTPDQFTPIQHPDNPHQLIGLMYSIDIPDSLLNSNITRKDLLFYIGTETEEPFFAVSNNNDKYTVVKQKYPYYYKNEPYLPFAVFRNDYPLTGEFVNRTQNEGLYNASLETGKLLSHFIRSVEDQSIKQLAISGPSSRDFQPNIIRDHMSILRIPYSRDQVEIKVLDYQIDLQAMWQSVLYFIESAISNYGLSIDRFKSTPQTGLAIRLSNESLRSKIEEQRSYFAEGENQLAEIIKKINNTLLPSPMFQKINDEANFRIEFGNLPFSQNPMELADTYIKLFENNIVSGPEFIKVLHPELSDAEAEERYKNNIDINKK